MNKLARGAAVAVAMVTVVASAVGVERAGATNPELSEVNDPEFVLQTDAKSEDGRIYDVEDTPAISGDGRWVYYVQRAREDDNYALEDTDWTIRRSDQASAGDNERIPDRQELVTTGLPTGEGDSAFIDEISTNYSGSKLAFTSAPLYTSESPLQIDFWHSQVYSMTGTGGALPSNPTLVSATNAGNRPNARSFTPTLADDGTVAFASDATNLAGGAGAGDYTDPDGWVFPSTDIYARVGTSVRLVSSDSSGNVASVPGSGVPVSTDPDISANGRWVAFTSSATNLAGGLADTNGKLDVFVKDVLPAGGGAGNTIRVSLKVTGGTTTQYSYDSVGPSISDDGRIVVFRTKKTVSGSTDDYAVVYDRAVNGNLGSMDAPGNTATYEFPYQLADSAEMTDAVVSGDGRIVAMPYHPSVECGLPEIDHDSWPGKSRIEQTVKAGDLVIGNIDELRTGTDPNPIVDKLRAGVNSCGGGVTINETGDFVAFPSMVNHSRLDDSPDGLTNAYVATSRFPFSVWNKIGNRPQGFITGDPVSVVTGSQIDSRTDLPSDLWGMTLERTYNSSGAYSTMFGEKWASSFSSKIHRDAGSDVLDLLQPDGQIVLFTKSGSAWIAPDYFEGTLTNGTGSTYTVAYRDQSFARYSSTGLLTQTGDAKGSVVDLTYTSGRLSGAAFSYKGVATGQTLTFSYADSDDFVDSITSSDGRQVDFTYEGERLTSASDAHFATESVWGVEAYDHIATGEIGRFRVRDNTDAEAEGRIVLANTFYGHGRIATQENEDGEITRFDYDRDNRVTTVTHEVSSDPADNDVWVYHYDEFGTVTSIDAPDETGSITREFDGEKPTSVTDRAGATTKSLYTADGYLKQKLSRDPNVETPVAIPTPDPTSGWVGMTITGWALEQYTYVAAADPRVATYTNAEGEVTKYTYSGSRKIPSKVEEGFGTAEVKTTTNSVTTDNVLTWTQDGDNVRTCFVYDAAGRIITQTEACTSANPRVTTFTYTAGGQVATRLDPAQQPVGGGSAGPAWVYTYTGTGKPLTETRPDGTAIHYEYDPVTESSTRFDELGNPTTTSIERRATSDCGIDSHGVGRSWCRKETTAAPGDGTTAQVTQSVYDRAGDLVESRTSSDGGVTWNATTSTYGAMGRRLSTTEPNGVTTSYVYDSNGKLTRTVQGSDLGDTARSEITEYDQLGRVTRRTAPADDGGSVVTATSYDKVGRVVQTVVAPDTPVAQTTTNEYYDNGLLKRTAVDRPDLGTGVQATTEYTYTPGGRETCVKTLVDSATATYSYAATDYAAGLPTRSRTNRTAVTGCADSKTSNTKWAISATAYDAYGRVLTTQTPVQYATKPMGTANFSANYATTYGYDAMGRQTTIASADPSNPGAGTVTSLTCYTARGEVSRSVDGSGNVTAYEYDPSGAVKTVVDPRGLDNIPYNPSSPGAACAAEPNDSWTGTVQYGYDGEGNRIARTSYNGASDPAVEHWTYDGPDSSYTDALGNVRTTHQEVNGAGVLTGTTETTGALVDPADPSGSSLRTKTTALYPSGRIASTTDVHLDSDSDPISTYVTSYSYDLAGRKTSVHGLETDAGGATTYDGAVDFEYDLGGNVTRVTYPSGLDASYTWDVGGRQTEAELPNHARYRYAYGVDGLLDDVDLHSPAAWLPLATYVYDANGNRTKETLLAGVVAGEFGGVRDWTYSTATGRMATLRQRLRHPSTLNHGVDSYWTTTWNKSGQLSSDCINTAKNGTSCNSATTHRGVSYSYDAAGQLTEASVVHRQTTDPESWSYEYGNRGERLAETVDNGSTSVTTDYSYDDALQLLSADPDDAEPASTFAYDAAGRRQSRTVGSATDATSYDARGMQYSFSGIELKNDPLGYMSSGNVATYYDYSGREAYPRLMMVGDEEGSYRFDFGNDSFLGYSGGDAPMVVLFGHDPLGSVTDVDAEGWEERWLYDPYGNPLGGSGLYAYRGEFTPYYMGQINLRARWYDPEVGAFTTRDPLDGVDGTPTVTAPYHYADNDPLNKVDPTGLRPHDPVGIPPAWPGYSRVCDDHDDYAVCVAFNKGSRKAMAQAYNFSDWAFTSWMLALSNGRSEKNRPSNRRDMWSVLIDNKTNADLSDGDFNSEGKYYVVYPNIGSRGRPGGGDGGMYGLPPSSFSTSPGELCAFLSVGGSFQPIGSIGGICHEF